MNTEKTTKEIFINPQKGDTIKTGFKTYRGDSRDPFQGPLEYGFFVGNKEHREENSRIACKALNAFNQLGLESFCWRWKNKGSLTIAEAIEKNFFKDGTVFEEKEKNRELIQYKGFMQGTSTDLAEPNYGDYFYVIEIPDPIEGFKCIECGGSPFRYALFSGKISEDKEICFTVITTPQSCEVDFFSNIPKEWIQKL